MKAKREKPIYGEIRNEQLHNYGQSDGHFTKNPREVWARCRYEYKNKRMKAVNKMHIN